MTRTAEIPLTRAETDAAAAEQVVADRRRDHADLHVQHQAAERAYNNAIAGGHLDTAVEHSTRARVLADLVAASRNAVTKAEEDAQPARDALAKHRLIDQHLAQHKALQVLAKQAEQEVDALKQHARAVAKRAADVVELLGRLEGASRTVHDSADAINRNHGAAVPGSEVHSASATVNHLHRTDLAVKNALNAATDVHGIRLP